MEEGKILIIPSKRIDPDLLLAAFTVARVFKARLGKSVEVVFDKEAIPAHLAEAYPHRDIKFTQTIEQKSFTINLKNKNAKIKDVKWEEKNGEIKLFITTEDGSIEEDAKVKASGHNYDTIIVMGIQKPEQMGKFYLDNKDLFSKSRVINIDLADNNTNFGTDNSFVDPEASSFSELAYAYLNELGLNPAAKEATDLLSGIIWRTKSFGINIHKPSIFETTAQLLNLNASILEANKQVLQTMSLLQLRYISEIIRNAKVSEDGIAWAKIYKSNLNSLNPRESIFPLSNILTFLKEAKISFILTEISPGQTLCDIRSNQKSIKCSQIAEVFGKTGTFQHANFIINKEINEAEKAVLDEIKTILAGSFPKKNKPQLNQNEAKEAAKTIESTQEAKTEDKDQTPITSSEGISESAPQSENPSPDMPFDPLPPAQP